MLRKEVKRSSTGLGCSRIQYVLLILSVSLMAWFWANLYFLKCDGVPAVFSFEDPSELSYFQFPNTSSLSISSKHYKDGYHSLLWKWSPRDKLVLPLGRHLEGKESGIKIWVYRNESSKNTANLTISLLDSTVGQHVVISFNFSLNFKGWRAAWVVLREAAIYPRNAAFDFIEIQAPVSGLSSNLVFIDLLCLCPKILRQSRDKIVPPISNSIYKITDTWQQVYKWSQVIPSPVDAETPLTQNEKQSLKNITLIKKRLYNWFANESLGPSHYKGVLKKRYEWLVLYKSQKARNILKELNITVSSDGILTGSPLFAKRSSFGNSKKVGGNKKLGWVTTSILFPLTLEYYFSTRPQNINNLIAKEVKNLNNPLKRKQSVLKISNNDEEFGQIVLSELRRYKNLANPRSLRSILQKLSDAKLDVIFQLLDYITDQGWNDGSSLGSLDHEMNVAGMGFIHSLFLLQPQLTKYGRLHYLLRTMKWYTEFGEIYQKTFLYNGTTADRMRTIMLYRLETIVMSPEETIRDQREKLRDMAAYRRWCNNALLVNTALSSIFKPDLSCFHHLGIYGTAYSPQALAIASVVYYLLDGTPYSLSNHSRENIRLRLDLYLRMAVLYSLPNSISGRFPDYYQAILIKMLPGYVYLSVAPQYLDINGTLEPVTLGHDTDTLKAFLRLYRPYEAKIQSYLLQGVPQHVTYLNTLGILESIQAVYKQAKIAGITGKGPPSGHWVMNYGALSIHRRHNWVVSVKGFSRYIWSFENGPTENIYGLYLCYGALEISNSEKSLVVHDVQHGWDWRKVPGTTTINVDLNQMVCKQSRYFQPSKLVGGVVLIGKNSDVANGAFAMDFRQPHYDFSFPSYKNPEDFRFKKSMFFFNNLVVCLGSDILAKKSEPNRTLTTLFQDKLVAPKQASVIYVNGRTIWLTDHLHMRINNSAAILDTNNNGYFVPKNVSLIVQISLQKSRSDSGHDVTYGRYATTWLDHGINPMEGHYEYAILVNTDITGIEALRDAQSSKSPQYEVLQKNSKAHVVVFHNTEKSSQLYSYAFYDPKTSTLGPVSNVSGECVVMAEIDPLSLNLSVSSPDLNFNTSGLPPYSSLITGKNEYFYMRSIPVEITVKLSCSVDLKVQRVLVNGQRIKTLRYDEYIQVIPDNHTGPELGGSQIWFKQLVEGESVEAFLMRKTDIMIH